MRHLLWAIAFILASLIWGWTGFWTVAVIWLVLFILGWVLVALGLGAFAVALASRNYRR